jgi:spermidine/putrescine ABC transporter ATP-binding subunit
MPPPIIRFQAITKRFGPDILAVDDVSLDIADNEFFALLGPSGCGKTTLLRMLAGFERPDAGAILLDGEDISRIPPNRRPVNMVFQSYAVFPHMSVGDNVAYGLRVAGMPRGDIKPRVRAALEMVRLAGYADRRPDSLSGGQRQRVALARALVKQPKVLLLDEPLSALDKKLRQEMQLELVRLRHELGITFVMVTHDQDEAMSVASRIGVMDGGRIVQLGAPRDIYEHPQSRFVADFIGSINLLEGEVRAVQGRTVRLAAPEADGELAAAENGAAGGPLPAPGASAWIGVRPEKLAVGRARPDGDANVLEGRLLEVAYLGENSVCHVRLDSGRIVRATVPNERRFASADMASGDRVFLSWPPASSILLRE